MFSYGDNSNYPPNTHVDKRHGVEPIGDHFPSQYQQPQILENENGSDDYPQIREEVFYEEESSANIVNMESISNSYSHG